MRVVFFSDDFPPTSFGGAGISTFELARGVRDAGNEVYAITTCRKPEDAGVVTYEGITVYKVASAYNGRWRAYKSVCNRKVLAKLAKILDTIKPDVVHVNNIHEHISWYSIRLAKKYAKRVVFTARDTMSVTYGKLVTKRYLETLNPKITWLDNVKQARLRYNPLRNILIKKYLAFADKKFAVSNALREALEKNGLDGFETLHTGIDTAVWQATQSEIDSFRARNNLAGKKVIMFGGRLSEAKGGAIAIEALAKIAREVPESVLLVAGDDSDAYAKHMHEKAKELGVGEKLIFSGWVARENMRIVYASADVVIVPSLYLDPFPRIVLEAMASAKPVIATPYGGAKEALKDGETGLVVNPLDSARMVGVVVDLLSDTNNAQKMGEDARRSMQQNFLLQTTIQNLLDRYNIILNGK